MRTVSIACLIMTCAGASAQQLTIADLAPEEAFLILGVDNAKSTIASFKKTGSFALFNDPEMRQWFGELIEEPMSEFQGFLDSIDASAEDFSEPSGMMGMAVWLNATKEGAQGNDAMPAHFLVSAEFGDDAVKMHDMIVRAFEAGEDEDSLTYSKEAMGEAQIYTVRPTEVEVDDAAGDDWDDDEWGDDEWANEAGGMSAGPEEFFYARHGEVLMLSTSLGDMENALSRIEGVGFDNASGTAAYSRLKPAGNSYDAYAVLINGPLYDMADSMAGDDENQLAMMGVPPIMTILDAVGLSEVRGASMTVSFDHEKGDTVGELFVSAPRLRGLMGLLNVPDKAFKVPSFVSQDAASISMFQVDLAGLFPAIKQALNNMPPEIAQQGQMLGMIEPSVQPLLAQLGPEIFITQTYRRPFDVDSQEVLVAIGTKDANAITNAFAQMAPMAGLEGRDFQGNQIWSMPEGGGGMLPIGSGGASIGFGFGYMFVGPDNAVEGAMRQAANGDSAFANDKGFQNAMKALSNNGLSFAYQNMEETLAYQAWTAKNMDKIIDKQIDQMFGDFDDEEMKQQMRESMMEANPMGGMPDMKNLAKYIGDSVMEYQLVDGGIKGTFVLLRADN